MSQCFCNTEWELLYTSLLPDGRKCALSMTACLAPVGKGWHRHLMSDCIAGLQLYTDVKHFVDVGDTLPFMFSVINEFSAGCGRALLCC